MNFLPCILTEIEAILNSRPLTYTYVDDIEESLTPTHLVIGRRLLMLSNDRVREEEEEFGSHATINKRAVYVATKIQHFWHRWNREYLADLREFHRLKKGNYKISPPLLLGKLFLSGTRQSYKDYGHWARWND